MPPDPVALLRHHLGYPAFRPGQEELVRAVLGGRDALGILPTGGGKSVCYQVPALALGGVTLVVTPLVSLMEDQVARASRAGLRAARLSAGQGRAERRRVTEAAESAGLDILFVAPERLETRAFAEVLPRLDVRLLAVDEAHCISEWGHDFRPAYRRIGRVRERLRAPVLALTATATPRVRLDVAASLGLRDPVVVVRSFDRPNLGWTVERVGARDDRIRRIGGLLAEVRGPAVVYAPTRGAVEAVRDGLAGRGVAVEAYHAGLAPEERSRVQSRFLGGGCRVVVATNAFGMGIDKADVRLVAHMQLPATLEAYYQEAGRAGRDGAPARCVALHHPRDASLARRFVDGSHPPPWRLRRLHRRLRRRAGADGTVRIPVGARAEWARGAVPAEDLAGALAALERAGGLRILEAPGEVDGAHAEGAWRLGVRARPTWTGAATLRASALAKVASVSAYARSRRCRRRHLLGYFGERAPPRCGACDRCRP